MKKFDDDVKMEVNVDEIVIGIVIAMFVVSVIICIANANVINLL